MTCPHCADKQRQIDAIIAICVYASSELKGLRAIGAQLARTALEQVITDSVTPIREPAPCGSGLERLIHADSYMGGQAIIDRLERAKEHGD